MNFTFPCQRILAAAPAHPHPYLMPPAEKKRLLERVRTNDVARQQFEAMKARAKEGKFADAALVFALEGGEKHAAAVRNHLLQLVRYRTPRLDEDIAAGGHRENNMEFYWDTADVRAYDLVYPALSPNERQTIESFFLKLGRYWKDSLNRWTTTPNLVFPIHYHGAVIGFCIDDEELIDWGLRNPGGQFGPTRGGLFPVLDAMLRDGVIWDEATIYAAVNVLQPMMQLAILHRLYYGKDLFAFESQKGASIQKLVDGYLALTYPIERTGVGPGSFHIATYGDGSTESPYSHHHNTDAIYLVNLPWVRGNYRYEIVDSIEQAHYVSRDPKYAWFLSYSVEREPSFLYGETIPLGSVAPPPAASSIFPEAGIAMLRADESPQYWTNGSMAVLQMMARGYGHDHRDKMMILLHAGGRLLYPDLNCIQYEPPSINWTASSVAHNTLVVDRGKTANAPFTYRHDFTPEVKFLATTASCYPGVQQTRVLALTREYLLDVFWAGSDLPHTYDWVLHALGKLQFEQPALYRPSSHLLQDYWWIENERARETAQTWRADFIQRNGLAIRGQGRQTDEWFNDRAAVRVTMLGEPGTTVYGADGPSGGPPVDPVMNPEGNAPLLLVRRQARQTVFAAVHEPYKQDSPAIAEVRKVAASTEANVIEVRAKTYLDRVAVTIGTQDAKPVHALRHERDPQEVFVSSNYGYLRETRPVAGERTRLVARGSWNGFRVRCPALPEQGALTLNGTSSSYRKEGDYVVFGEVGRVPKPAGPKSNVSSADTASGHKESADAVGPTQPLEIVAPAEPVRLGTRDEREIALQLRNESASDHPVRVRVHMPQAISAQPTDGSVVTREVKPDGGVSFSWTLTSVAAGHTVNVRLRLATDGSEEPGLHPASVQVRATERDTWTLPVALPITVGPVLVEDNSFPTFGEYVIYAPRYTFRLSKRYGTSRFLRDDANRPRYEATFWDRRPPAATAPEALPRVRINDQDWLAWGKPADFLWPNTAPASVTIGAGKSRIAWSFENDAIRLEPVALWSAEAPHEFILPGEGLGWTAWGGRPVWLRIIAVNESGQEQVLTQPPAKSQSIVCQAAALHVPGYDEAVCFAADRPQSAQFDGASVRFRVNPGEPLWFGLAQPAAFENWWKSRRSDMTRETKRPK